MTPIALMVMLAACGQGAASQTSSTATAPLGAPVVSLTTSAGVPVRIVGGTATMRARARAVLNGMGDVAIAEVRFGRPPASSRRFRRLDGPIWLSTTVAVDGTPFAGRLRSQFDADGRLWQASAFETAYLASQPAGQPRIRGTSEAFSIAGRRRPFSSETGPVTRYGGAALSDAEVRSLVARAAARARFRVVSISLMHPDRQAATIVVRALHRTSFARRYGAFHAGLAALTGRLDGLQWEVVDACGYPVAVESTGIWTSPDWLCPNPFVPGPQMTRATCRKLPRGFPPCGS